MTRRKNGPGAITPVLAARVIELAEKGLGTTAIERELGNVVTRQALDAFLKRRRPKSTHPAGEERRARPEPTSEAEAVLEEGTAGGVVDVARRLGKVSALVDKLEENDDLLKGVVSPVLYEKLVKLEADLSERIEGMRPPTPPDPESDIGNRAAADRLVAKIERSVKAAEERAVCQNCGRRPW